jgi:choice-of-anchor A domain-containing protein
MTTTTSSKTYANVTDGDLTFSGITVNETDIINGSSILNSFTSSLVSPVADTVGSELGMSWSAFSMLVASDGSGVSQTDNFSYNISTSGNDYITAIDSVYAIDQQAGDGTFTAVESIYDSSGDLLGTQTFSSNANPPAPTQLTEGVQNAHVTLQITETASSSGSLISASILAQLFTETPASALAALGDYVWMDTNDNGLQDSGETGVGGVTVDLLNSSGSVIGVTTTNATGYYHFTGLLPGVYDVQFVAPVGDSFTLTSVGTNTAIDSNANQTTGLTAPVTLTAGQTDNTIDAGLTVPHQTLPAALGDYVWFDANGNGLQDTGETGVAGVTVDLLNAAGTTVLGVTTTNATGYYYFTDLTPGTYDVRFFAPAGDNFTITSAGTNTAIDSNANQTTGLTAPVTLTSGQTDLTIDAGLVAQPAALGDYVWFDSNANGLQDSGESGVAGVTVDLLNAAGTSVLGVTTTNATGYYYFTDLAPGVYDVRFFAPAGDKFTITSAGTNRAIDSNANQTTGLTAPVTLTAGQTDLTIDAGLVGTPGLVVNKIPGSMVVNSAGQETYSFSVTNTGSVPLTNVQIKDNIGTAANPIYTTPTLVTTGTNGTLAAGQTWTYTETVTQGSYTNGSSGTVSSGGLTAAMILNDFDVVVYGNASANSDIEGAAVIGGNFSGATMYTKPPASLPSGFGALTVYGGTSGNSINLNSGGSAYVAGTKGAGINFNGGGKYISAPPDTIANFETPLNALSTSLSGLAATGTLPTAGNNEVIKAVPGANGIAVIDATAAQLAAIPSYSINLNGASTLVINVSGGSVSFNANDESGTTGADNIIWNFYNASTVSLGTQIAGTVLAPSATVSNNNQIDGALVAKAFNGGGEVHEYAFTGTLPTSLGSPGTNGVADTATVTASAVGTGTVSASDTAEIEVLGTNTDVTTNGTAPTTSLSGTYGNAQTLEFVYNPSNTVSTKTTSIGASSGSNSNTMAFIAIGNNSNPNATGAQLYFEGTVASGQELYADAAINALTNTANSGAAAFMSTTAGANIYADIYTSQAAFLSGAAPVQVDTYNASGSQAMYLNDQIGSLKLVGYVGTTGGHLAT